MERIFKYTRLHLTCLWAYTTLPSNFHVPPRRSIRTIRSIWKNRRPRSALVANTCPDVPIPITTIDAPIVITSDLRVCVCVCQKKGKRSNVISEWNLRILHNLNMNTLIFNYLNDFDLIMNRNISTWKVNGKKKTIYIKLWLISKWMIGYTYLWYKMVVWEISSGPWVLDSGSDNPMTIVYTYKRRSITFFAQKWKEHFATRRMAKCTNTRQHTPHEVKCVHNHKRKIHSNEKESKKE